MAIEAFDYAWRSATEARMHDLDAVPNSVDRLQRFIANFVGQRPVVPGGCPLLNTAVESDDGNPVLRERARSALSQWQSRLRRIISNGVRKREIRAATSPKKLATLIISSLEGALMISRLEGSDEALRAVQTHLDQYLESNVRSGRSR